MGFSLKKSPDCYAVHLYHYPFWMPLMFFTEWEFSILIMLWWPLLKKYPELKRRRHKNNKPFSDLFQYILFFLILLYRTPENKVTMYETASLITNYTLHVSVGNSQLCYYLLFIFSSLTALMDLWLLALWT